MMFLDVTWLEPPKVFISSTMDKITKVIREEMSKKIDESGYTLLRFENNSFPYGNDMNETVIDETINAVANANIFVLIVDENYGTVIDNRSVIHREYARARDLNLPIYVFIQEDVWVDYNTKKIGINSHVKSDEHYRFITELAKYKIQKYSTPTQCADYLQAQLLNFLGGALKFSSKSSWLWNENYTRSIEKSAREVWIITPDFLWDFDDPQFRKIVVNNVTERKVKYKYIFLKNSENSKKKNEMIRQYKMIFKKKGENADIADSLVQYIAVNDNKFFWSCEQILFNPFSLDERAIMVDIMDVRDRTLKFNIEYGYGKRMMFREKFIEFWNNFHKGNTSLHINPSNYDC